LKLLFYSCSINHDGRGKIVQKEGGNPQMYYDWDDVILIDEVPVTGRGGVSGFAVF